MGVSFSNTCQLGYSQQMARNNPYYERSFLKVSTENKFMLRAMSPQGFSRSLVPIVLIKRCITFDSDSDLEVTMSQ
jgi:hypothetical protein